MIPVGFEVDHTRIKRLEKYHTHPQMQAIMEQNPGLPVIFRRALGEQNRVYVGEYLDIDILDAHSLPFTSRADLWDELDRLLNDARRYVTDGTIESVANQYERYWKPCIIMEVPYP